MTDDASAPEGPAQKTPAPQASVPQASAAQTSPPDAIGRPAGVTSRRLHPVTPFADLFVWIPRLWAPALFAISRPGGRWLLPIGVVLLLAGRVLVWWRTTWSFDGRELVVARGWLRRTVRSVPIARLQQVEVTRKLRHQVFRVAAIRVQLAAAGPGDDDVALDVLSLRDAEALRVAMEDARRAATLGEDVVASVPAPPAHELLRLSPGLLAAGGLTGATLLVVPAAVTALLGNLDDIGLDDDAEDVAGQLPVVWLAVAVLVVSLVAAVGISVVRHHGLRVARRSTDLVFERGLLERRSSVIPLARVQVVRVHRNVVRRRLGLASVDVATGGHVRAEGTGSMDDAVPVARWADAERLAAIALGGREVVAAGEAAVRSARRRLVVLRVARAVLLSAWAPLAFGARGWWLPVAAAIAAAASAVVAGLARRHGVGDQVLVVEEGTWWWRRQLVPLDRVQSWHVGQGPLQRRLGLRDVSVHLAGQPPVVVHDASEHQSVLLLAAVRTAVERRAR